MSQFPPLVELQPSHQSLLPGGPRQALADSEVSRYRLLWRNLSKDDSPAYPVEGFGEILDAIRKSGADAGASEVLILVAEVDSQGHVTRVRTVRYADDRLVKSATWILVDTLFHPATCAGSPCASTVPVIVKVPRT